MKRLYLLVGSCLAVAVGMLFFGERIFLLPGGVGAALILFGLYRQGDPYVLAGFGILVLTAAFSAWGNGHPRELLTSVCASLTAWDLASYLLLLRRVGVLPEASFTRRHMLRLAVALITGWGLGSATLALKLTLSFGALLGLALFVVLGLAVGMLYLRRQDEI